MNINGIRNRFSKVAAGLITALAVAGCADLEVRNLNDPDRDRAVASPSDVEALISGGFRSWYDVAHKYSPAGAMSVAADAHTSSWGNFGMRDSGWEPRKAFNNDPSYSYSTVAEVPWNNSYRALAAARDGLLAIEGGVRISDDPDNPDATDNTQRAVVFGKFVQAMSLAHLAIIFDQAFIVDETVEDVLALDLASYDQVWTAAEAKFDEVIQMASSASFSIPSTWVGFNGDWSGPYLAEVARAFKTRYRTQVPRSPAERDAVDWSLVLRDASAGLSKDFAGYYEEGGNWAWHVSKLHLAIYTGWARIDYRTVGPADASGEWERWIAAGPEQKTPFNIDTDDRRITGASPTTSGKYIRYMGNSPFPADRGIYHYSNYIDWRWDKLRQNRFIGEWPDMTALELEFLAAEANYHLGNMDATMEVVNKYRTENGELPPFTDPSGVAPGGDRCVPQLPSGACGTLWDAYKYEKRIELFHYGMGTEYFDDRGWGDLVTGTWQQLPIPGSELGVLLMEIYTFGGIGGPSSAPDIVGGLQNFVNDVSSPVLSVKRATMDAWHSLSPTRIEDANRLVKR